MRPLSIAKRDRIVTLLNSGTSAHDIHRLTGASTVLSPKSMQSTVLSSQSPLEAALASSLLQILIMLSV